jgi:hypothetical protein
MANDPPKEDDVDPSDQQAAETETDASSQTQMCERWGVITGQRPGNSHPRNSHPGKGWFS